MLRALSALSRGTTSATSSRVSRRMGKWFLYHLQCKSLFLQARMLCSFQSGNARGRVLTSLSSRGGFSQFLYRCVPIRFLFQRQSLQSVYRIWSQFLLGVRRPSRGVRTSSSLFLLRAFPEVLLSSFLAWVTVRLPILLQVAIFRALPGRPPWASEGKGVRYDFRSFRPL